MYFFDVVLMVSEVQGFLLSQFNGWGSGGPLTTVAQARLGIKNKTRNNFFIFYSYEVEEVQAFLQAASLLLLVVLESFLFQGIVYVAS